MSLGSSCFCSVRGEVGERVRVKVWLRYVVMGVRQGEYSCLDF